LIRRNCEFSTKGRPHVQVDSNKGDLTVTDDNGTVTLPQGQQTTRDDQSNQPDNKKKKKRGGGAAPAASGGLLNSTVAVGVGAAAITGVAVWLLVTHQEDAISPNVP
jgi:hypothetical protein